MLLTKAELLQAINEGAQIRSNAAGEMEVLTLHGETDRSHVNELLQKGLLKRSNAPGGFEITHAGMQACVPEQIA